MTSKLDYIAGAIVSSGRERGIGFKLDTLSSIESILSVDYKLNLNESQIISLLGRLKELDLTIFGIDEYAGIFFYNDLIKPLAEQSEKVPNNSEFSIFRKSRYWKRPVLKKVFDNDRFWDDLNREISEKKDKKELENESNVPASDRIVSLSDNQRVELEISSSELIAEVEKSNGIDGDPTFRQIVLGQLKAGREMIRAQIFSAELMRLIMMDTLKSLIKKYEGHAIGAAAATLMELLIKHVVGAD